MLSVSYGTLFWTSLAFILVLVILKKVAWKPILKALSERERSIEEAIESARLAREEMAKLKSSNEELQKKAREERDLILKEAREIRETIIAEAKTKAQQEADRVIAASRETLKNEKLAAISELKNQVAHLSIEIAEKILRKELNSDDKQQALVHNLVEEINLN